MQVARIPYTITGTTLTGQYWHRVWQDSRGQIRTWCSHHLVTALRPKADSKDSLQLCWKLGCY